VNAAALTTIATPAKTNFNDANAEVINATTAVG
jgi:hypothetical protein